MNVRKQLSRWLVAVLLLASAAAWAQPQPQPQPAAPAPAAAAAQPAPASPDAAGAPADAQPTPRPRRQRPPAGPPPRTYYVAPTGDDASSGTLAAPLKTIQKGVDSIHPGDTVTIAAGVYKEHVALHRSGAYLGGTVHIGAAKDAQVVIDGEGMELNEDAIFTTNGQDYLVISGIAVQNSTGRGIGVEGSWQVTLENCRSLNTVQSGLHVDKSGTVRVTGCEVEKACIRAGEESVSVKRSQDVEIRDCHVHHTGHEGIDIKEGAKHVRVVNCEVDHVERQGIYAEAWDSPTFDIRFENNRVHDCSFGIVAGSECGGLLSDVWFVGNVVYNCPRGPGMSVPDFGGRYPHPVKNIYFINNTVWKTGSSGWGGGMDFHNPAAENVVVVNNILSQNLPEQLHITPGKAGATMVVKGNLIDGVSAGEWPGQIVGEAKFVKPEAGDFHIQSDSAAFQAGKNYEKPEEKVDLGAVPFDVQKTGGNEVLVPIR